MKPTFKTLDQKRQTRVEKTERSKPFNKPAKGTLARQVRESDTPTYPTHGKTARGLEVKISVKTDHAKPQKKTGALSPRAPEKIRKNRAQEMKVYGENACLSLFQQRPEAIVRLWATIEMAHKIGNITHYLAEQKKAYHIVSQEELTLVCGTEHHGGICFLAKKSQPLSLDGYLQLPKTHDCLVVLDGVNNAQNIGGIMRTCAFYGVTGIVVENGEALFSSNAARVAEGGLEFVKALETKHKHIALANLRAAGYQIVHLTRNKQATHLAKTNLANKVAFVLSEILPLDADDHQDTAVQLSFNNPLQSGLNVASACAVLLGAWYQTHQI